ncbi:hypothetical protein ABBQ32_008795 [Trebouxia sp. C0010 RCD-2024]
MSVLKRQLPWFIHAGGKRIANDPILIAWQQCGLAEPWDLGFQLEARGLMDAGTLFSQGSTSHDVSEGIDSEATIQGDAVDADGNPVNQPRSDQVLLPTITVRGRGRGRGEARVKGSNAKLQRTSVNSSAAITHLNHLKV